MTITHTIISRRCDRQMRRSKEQGHLPSGRRWRCTEDCNTCFCCIEKIEDGTERHFSYRRHDK